MKELLAAIENAMVKNPKMATTLIRSACDLIDADPALLAQLATLVKTKAA